MKVVQSLVVLILDTFETDPYTFNIPRIYCQISYQPYDIYMIYLSIETSCDETALSIVETTDNKKELLIHSNLVISQIDIHQEYGGVFPALAKREHAKNLVPLLKQALTEAKLSTKEEDIQTHELSALLDREPELLQQLQKFLKNSQVPNIDAIVVTQGPGLAPALWVGVNFARALSYVWNIPIIPVNHMEGHISSVVLESTTNKKEVIKTITFPAIALLISGGHTQLVKVDTWGSYDIIGNTLDDAVGEAFDKVARMLDLPYPGGPQISRLAKEGRENELISLPRPMISSGDVNFSFSGLKTACRYLIEDLEKNDNLTDQHTKDLAFEFEHAVTEVLLAKTKKALIEYNAKSLIIAGGVSANRFIRSSFQDLLNKEFSEVDLHIPVTQLCGDNSLMIATVAVIHEFKNIQKTVSYQELQAKAGLTLGSSTDA